MPNNDTNSKDNRPNNIKDFSKTAANAAFGPLGGKAVDIAANTKLGNQVLKSGSNALNGLDNLNAKGKLGNKQSLNNKNNPNNQRNDSATKKINQNRDKNSNGQNNNNSQNRQREQSKANRGFGGLGRKALSSINPFTKKRDIAEEDELENQSALKSIKNSGFVKFIIKYKKIISLLAPSSIVGGCGCSIGFLAIIVVIINIMNPLFAINNIMYNVSNRVNSVFGSFIERMSNVARCGFVTDEECQIKLDEKEAKNKDDFFDALQKSYEDHLDEYNVQIELSLLTATLTYYDYYDPGLYDDGITAVTDSNGNITGYVDIDGNKVELSNKQEINYKKSKKKINELADQMISDPIPIYNEKGEQIGVRYELDLDKYEKYLPSFVKNFYFSNDTSNLIDDKVKQAIQDIHDRVDFYNYVMGSTNSYTKVYGYCSGVTVVDEDGNVEDTVSLDDYIAGVVEHETYDDAGIEAMKAQAIAARTYLLYNTNNCSIPIMNSTKSQTYSSTPSEKAIKAANDTSGEVMIYQDKLFSAQYDSFCYNDQDCPDSIKSNGKYSVTYTKLPAGEKHTVEFTDSSKFWRIMEHAGHARGMSQLVAAQMADNGSSSDDILNYFYSSGVKVTNMITTKTGLFTSATAIPTSMEELRERSEIYASMGTVILGGKSLDLTLMYSYGTANIGQCVWYAKSRALELIYFSNMPDDQKASAYLAVASTKGNGEGWYKASSLDVFTKTTDYTQPHVGSIVSWSGGSNKCSPACGHVAIIESVDMTNGTVVLSDGYKEGSWSSSSWNSVIVNGPRTFTFEQLKNYNSSYYTHMNGYVYILG